MTIQSYTGTINTGTDFESVSTLTGVTFTSGTTYTMQIQGLAWLKIGDAVFLIKGETPFEYKAGSEDLYIKTTGHDAILTILENE